MAGVPSNIIIPWVGMEFDASNAFSGSSTTPITGLIIGQKLAAGTGLVDTKYLVSRADEVAIHAGFGSQAHRMALKYFKNNNITTTYLIMQDDAATSTAAVQATTIAGTATKAGELDIYINGDRYAVPVAIDDTAAVIGALAVTVIEDNISASVVPTFLTDTLTLTAKNKGINAGDMDVRLNYNSGEAVPTGLTVTPGAVTPGTVDPDAADVIAAIGETWFNVIANPYIDNTNLNLIEDFAEANDDIMVQRDGYWYCAKRATRSEMITFGADTANRNSRFVITVPSYMRMETTYELAAGLAGATADSLQNDIGQPLHRMTLSGFNVLSEDDLWTGTERNQLAVNGIATLTDSNGVQTESTVTMYLKNSAGAPDVAYQYQNTCFILMDLRYSFVNWILSKYPRARLGNNADVVKSGIQIMTPSTGKAEAVAWFKVKERDGLVEDVDAFKAQLVTARDTNNVNRMNWLLPPDLMNQFIVGSVINQFQLQGA